jgi:DNA-binding Xre family transcriptional regulator
MDLQLSYRKLRIILMDRKLRINTVCKAVGVCRSVGTSIHQDKNIGLDNLCKICLYLGIKLDDAVDFKWVE